VLENDGEFQRWKIDRRNSLRMERDRRAQELTRLDLEKIRNKAVAGLGPQPEVQLASAKAMVPSKVGIPAPANHPTPGTGPSTAPSAAPQRKQSFDLGGGGGSGPVGPLFILGLLALRRMRNKRA
jgi:hypothetical protein